MKLFKLICWIVHLFDRDVTVFVHSPRNDHTAVWSNGEVTAFHEQADPAQIITTDGYYNDLR